MKNRELSTRRVKDEWGDWVARIVESGGEFRAEYDRYFVHWERNEKSSKWFSSEDEAISAAHKFLDDHDTQNPDAQKGYYVQERSLRADVEKLTAELERIQLQMESLCRDGKV